MKRNSIRHGTTSCVVLVDGVENIGERQQEQEHENENENETSKESTNTFVVKEGVDLAPFSSAQHEEEGSTQQEQYYQDESGMSMKLVAVPTRSSPSRKANADGDAAVAAAAAASFVSSVGPKATPFTPQSSDKVTPPPLAPPPLPPPPPLIGEEPLPLHIEIPQPPTFLPKQARHSRLFLFPPMGSSLQNDNNTTTDDNDVDDHCDDNKRRMMTSKTSPFLLSPPMPDPHAPLPSAIKRLKPRRQFYFPERHFLTGDGKLSATTGTETTNAGTAARQQSTSSSSTSSSSISSTTTTSSPSLSVPTCYASASGIAVGGGGGGLATSSSSSLYSTRHPKKLRVGSFKSLDRPFSPFSFGSENTSPSPSSSPGMYSLAVATTNDTKTTTTSVVRNMDGDHDSDVGNHEETSFATDAAIKGKKKPERRRRRRRQLRFEPVLISSQGGTGNGPDGDRGKTSHSTTGSSSTIAPSVPQRSLGQPRRRRPIARPQPVRKPFVSMFDAISFADNDSITTTKHNDDDDDIDIDNNNTTTVTSSFGGILSSSSASAFSTATTIATGTTSTVTTKTRFQTTVVDNFRLPLS